MHRFLQLLPLALALPLALGGCNDIAGFNGNPQMRPGQDCLSCHSASGMASGLTYSVGGTVYPAAYTGTLGGLNGAKINIVDANQRQITLQSNGAGNFYSAEPLKFPISVSIDYGDNQFTMQAPVPIGSCNVCHRIDDNQGFTAATPLVPELAEDAGFGFPPTGHVYAFAGCPVPPVDTCPSPVPSYTKQIAPLLQINCTLCHPGSYTPIGLKTHDQIVDGGHLSEDRDDIAGCMMPRPVIPRDGGFSRYFYMSPDAAEIIIGWINCGAPDDSDGGGA